MTCNELKWVEMDWHELEMSWNYLNWSEMSWNELKWAEMRQNQLKLAEINWSELKWTEMSWRELKWAEMSWNEPEMSWNDLKWIENPNNVQHGQPRNLQELRIHPQMKKSKTFKPSSAREFPMFGPPGIRQTRTTDVPLKSNPRIPRKRSVVGSPNPSFCRWFDSSEIHPFENFQYLGALKRTKLEPQTFY